MAMALLLPCKYSLMLDNSSMYSYVCLAESRVTTGLERLKVRTFIYCCLQNGIGLQFEVVY